MEIIPEQFDKLPKWAKQYIEMLKKRIENLEMSNNAMSTSPVARENLPIGIYYRDPALDSSKYLRAIPPEVDVIVSIPDGQFSISTYRAEKNGMSIMMIEGRDMAIMPESSNHVKIKSVNLR